MKKTSIILLAFLFQNCIAINIGQNGYSSLSESEKEQVLPFEQARFQEPGNHKENCNVFEINTANIKPLLEEQEYTWIHIWLPYCSNESCTNIAQYENIEKRNQSHGLKLILASLTYDLENINKYVRAANFSNPVFVLQSSYYGTKLKDIRQKFHSEIHPEYAETGDVYYSDYLFAGDRLVYMGDEMNDSIVEHYSSATHPTNE
ncbi:MAG: hypothetical protein ACQERC_03570 [Bacteroidota bacterium]